MFYISRNDAIIEDPGESLYTIAKENDEIFILADLVKNVNLDYDGKKPRHSSRYRVESFSPVKDWKLDRNFVENPHVSAIRENQDRNDGKIVFYFETPDDWNYYFGDVYSCLFDLTPSAQEEVAVVDSTEEVFSLPDGTWHVIVKDGVL